jgi:hypothetical protein
MADQKETNTIAVFAALGAIIAGALVPVIDSDFGKGFLTGLALVSLVVAGSALSKARK